MTKRKTKVAEKNNAEYSFRRGYLQVKQKDAQQVKELLMRDLCIKSHPSWQSRLFGRIEPKVSEAQAIENIFAEYGIKDIWGLE